MMRGGHPRAARRHALTGTCFGLALVLAGLAPGVPAHDRQSDGSPRYPLAQDRDTSAQHHHRRQYGASRRDLSARRAPERQHYAPYPRDIKSQRDQRSRRDTYGAGQRDYYRGRDEHRANHARGAYGNNNPRQPAHAHKHFGNNNEPRRERWRHGYQHSAPTRLPGYHAGDGQREVYPGLKRSPSVPRALRRDPYQY